MIRRTSRCYCLRAALAIGLVACIPQGLGAQAATAAAAGAADREAVLRAARSFSESYVRGDATALAAHFTDDAVVLPPGDSAVRGRESIRRFWARDLASITPTQHRTTPSAVDVVGDVAYDHGTYEILWTRRGAAGRTSGKYLVVWRRGADGRWRMRADMWNALPRPSP